LELVFDGNCKQALNILQVLSVSSWDKDKMMMLKLHCALIYTKSEYGSFVYISASKSELSILDAVHNAGIRLATGAFCTSHFSNTYMELRVTTVLVEGPPPVTQPSWQYIPITHLTLQFSIHLSITGTRSTLEFLDLFVYDSSIS